MKTPQTTEGVTHTHTQSNLDAIKNIIFIIFTIVLIVINIMGIFSTDYWTDEVFSINIIKLSVKDLVATTASDVHPPLYYFILKASYLIFGDTTLAYGLPSIIPVILLILFSATVINRKYGKKTAMLFMILISFLKCCLQYNVEVRMYSWVNFFITMCFWFACELILSNKNNNKLNWILFTLFGILAAYTHYYALLAVACMYFVVFLIYILRDRKNIWKCVLCLAASIVLYLPWLFVFLKSFATVSENYWITGIPSFKSCMRFLIGTNIFGKVTWFLLIITVIIGFCKAFIKIKVNKNDLKIYLKIPKKIKINKNRDSIKMYLKLPIKIYKNKQVQELFLVLFTVIGTILGSILISKIIRPLFVTRYIYLLVGMIALSLSVALFKVIDNKFIGYLIIIAMFLGGFITWINYQDKIHEENLQTQEMVDIINEGWTDNSQIVTDYGHLNGRVLDYYFDDYQHYLYDETEIEDYKNSTTYLMITSEVDEDFESELENENMSIDFLTSGRFAGEGKTVYLYKICDV